jgi:hypothetical protein
MVSKKQYKNYRKEPKRWREKSLNESWYLAKEVKGVAQWAEECQGYRVNFLL